MGLQALPVVPQPRCGLQVRTAELAVTAIRTHWPNEGTPTIAVLWHNAPHELAAGATHAECCSQRQTHLAFTTHGVSVWCLCRGLSKVARSVLLTSGTLSPLDSFSGELGLDFQVRLEAPHVVDINKQVNINGAPMSGLVAALSAASAVVC